MSTGAFEVAEDADAVARGRRRVGDAAASYATAHQQVTIGVRRAAERWSGPRSTLFEAAGHGTVALLARAHDGCADVGAALGELAAAVRRAEDELAHLEAQQHALPLHLQTGPAEQTGIFGDAHRRAGALAQRAREVAHDLHRTERAVAHRIDTATDRLAPRLSSLPPAAITRRVADGLGGGTGGSVGGAAGSGVHGALATLSGALLVDSRGTVTLMPGPDAGPVRVHRWWTGLDPDQRAHLLHADPAHLGNLDGIPLRDRDTANRVVLAQQLASMRADLAALGKEPPVLVLGAGSTSLLLSADWLAWHRRRRDLLRRISGSEVIWDRLTGESRPAYLLLGYQPRHGTGRAIVSRGDPDTARQTGVLVPGTFAGLGSIGVTLARGDSLVGPAGRDAGPDVAVVTWYGYDAPQSIPSDAARLGFARSAAPVLRRFATGLRATHRRPGPSTVHLFAHSYGTTVAGQAASHGHRLDVDDLVLVASPGAGVGHGWTAAGTVADLRLSGPSRGHVFATRSRRDPIRLATATHLGVDPVDPRFGAVVFGSDPDGGHDDYWQRASASRTTMSQILAGHGGRVRPPTPDQAVDATEGGVPWLRGTGIPHW